MMIKNKFIFIVLLFIVTRPIMAAEDAVRPVADFITNKSINDLKKELLQALEALKKIDNEEYIMDHQGQEHYDKFKKAQSHKDTCNDQLNVAQKKLYDDLKIYEIELEITELKNDIEIINDNIVNTTKPERKDDLNKQLTEQKRKLQEKIDLLSKNKNDLNKRIERLNEERNNAINDFESAKKDWEKNRKQKDVSDRTITDSHIDEIKKIWHQLMYQQILELSEKDPEHFTFLNQAPLDTFKRGFDIEVFVYSHPDKFSMQNNNEKITKLFAFFASWETPQLQLFVKPQRLIKSTTKFIDFIKKLKQFEQSSILPISRKELNTAKKLWAATLPYSNDISNHYESMSQDLKTKINNLMKQSSWDEEDNKTKVAELFSFINSSKEQDQFIELQNLQDRFLSYLLRLKRFDEAGKEIEENQFATLKKLWSSIISSDPKNKSFLDMDSEFQKSIHYYLRSNWIKNSKKIIDIFHVMSSESKTKKLVSSYKPQKIFIDNLKNLHQLDLQGKTISDNDIRVLMFDWEMLKNKNQNNDKFFHDMDEEFRITTKIYSLPHNWKANNRIKMTNFFKKVLGMPSRLDTISSVTVAESLERKTEDEIFSNFEISFVSNPIYMIAKKVSNSAEELLRTVIDPSYHLANATLTPKALNRRFKSALKNLKTSSMPDIALEEIEHLSAQMNLLKQFYNYNWLDRILYPFHQDDIQSLKEDFSVLYDQELLDSIHPDKFQNRDDIQKAVKVFSTIEKLKSGLLERPVKPLEIDLFRAMKNSENIQKDLGNLWNRATGLLFFGLRKMSPDLWKTRVQKSNFAIFERKINTTKQENILGKKGLKRRKEMLEFEKHRLKLQSSVQSRFATI